MMIYLEGTLCTRLLAGTAWRFTSRFLATAFCAVLLIHSLAPPIHCQSVLSEITGEVRDPSGNIVPGTAVVLTNEATGVQTRMTTNEAGLFNGRSVLPGVYRIEAKVEGFNSYVATQVELRTGQILRHDITLQVGDVTQQVRVVGDVGAVEIQRDSGEISSVLNFQTIKEMPSGTRKVLELVELTPGVTLTGRGSAQAQTLAFFSVAGNPGTRSNIYFVDGANTAFPRVQGDGGNLPAMNPPTEVVQEMRVISNNYSAEFGEGIGGVIIMTTKSGTNQFKGQAYYFGQNDKLNARNFFAQSVPQVRYNNYGLVVGGPIKKDKTHFLYNYERETNGSFSPVIQTLPTLQQRLGDFSRTVNAAGQLVSIYDPATTRTDPVTGRSVRDPFPGNVIPADRQDPIAKNVLTNFVPDPNQSGTISGGNNFLANAKTVDVTRNWHFSRLDHILSPSDTLHGHVTFDLPNYPTNGPWVGTRGENADLGAQDRRQTNKTVGIGWTRVISPTTLSDFRFSYVAFTMNFRSLGRQEDVWLKDMAGKLGLRNLSPDTFPQFAPAGYQAIGGASGANIIYRTMRGVTLSETLSQQRGRHALRVGFEWKHSKAVFASRQFPSGRSSYDNLATAQPGEAGTGNSIASFLLGNVATAGIQDTPAADTRTWFGAAFFQDDWRVNSKLTLNLGARWEYERPKVDVKEYQNFFNFDKINPVCNCPGVIEFGSNRWTLTQKNTPLWEGQPNNIAPRVGFAWKPLSKEDLVVRGGYGMFYTGPEYGDSFWDGPMAGRGASVDWAQDGLGITPAFKLSQGFPNIPIEPFNDSFGAVPIGQLPRFAPRYWVQERAPGYSQQANLSVQKQFGSSLLEVGYLGNSSKHLPNRAYNPNEVRPELRGPGNAQIRRPFPQFGDLLGYSNFQESSLYHAGLIAFRRHFSGGFSFQTNYTFSRFLDTISYKRSDYDRDVDYGPSPLERRHRWIWSSVYEVPFGPGKRFLKDGLVGNILGGWLMGAFINLQTGQPVFLTNVANTCNCFTRGTQGANVSGSTARASDSFDPGAGPWFNTTAFSAPAPYTFGNAGRDLIYAPNLNVVNLNLTKSFRFRERYAVELRGEAFNLMNTVSFNPPSAQFGSPNFGRVTSAAPARVVQYAVRLQF